MQAKASNAERRLPLAPLRYRHTPGLSAGAAWVAALIYACLLIAIPWSTVRGEPFFDLTVYIQSFDAGAYDYLDQLEGLAYFFSEPLWRQFVGALTAVVGDVETAFQCISFSTSAVYAYVMLRAHPMTAIFLPGPLLIDLLLSQVRSAVAGALFLVALLAGGAFLSIGLLAVASLVHSAALLLFGTLAVSVLLNRAHPQYPRLCMACAVGISILLPLAFAASYVNLLSLIGDRRAETEPAWPGGVFVLSFAIYYAVLLLNLRRVMRHTLTVFSLIVSGLFVVLASFDINMLRFISLTFPILILAALRMPVLERLLLVSTLLAMCLYHLALWL